MPIPLRRSAQLQDTILLIGDYNWRKRAGWRRVFAWAFGSREVFRTHLGDVAEVSWWRDEPFLVNLWDGDA